MLVKPAEHFYSVQFNQENNPGTLPLPDDDTVPDCILDAVTT